MFHAVSEYMQYANCMGGVCSLKKQIVFFKLLNFSNSIGYNRFKLLCGLTDPNLPTTKLSLRKITIKTN